MLANEFELPYSDSAGTSSAMKELAKVHVDPWRPFCASAQPIANSSRLTKGLVMGGLLVPVNWTLAVYRRKLTRAGLGAISAADLRYAQMSRIIESRNH
jgi:hypothetical protein